MWPESPGVAVVSLTWRDAPSRARARVSEPLSEGAWDGLHTQGATGLVELHTCARSLWLVSGEQPAWLASLMEAYVAGRAGTAPTVRVGEDAARFVLQVSVGLDSFVQGEADVGRQVAGAFTVARREGRTDGVLNAVEQAVAHLTAAGHREGFVRANRGLGQLAVGWLEDHGADRTRPVGVVGAGAIGARVVASLRRAGWAPPVVYNRSPAPGARGLDTIEAHEALVVCTAGPARWFTPPFAARWVVDLGQPPQVAVPAVTLDELLTGDPHALAPSQVARAEAAVEREVRGLADRLRGVTFRRGLAHANTLRDRFLNESLEDVLGEGLEGLDPDQRRRVVRAAESAIRRYNHRLLAWLREGMAEEQ